jgi:hypothetical protein
MTVGALRDGRRRLAALRSQVRGPVDESADKCVPTEWPVPRSVWTLLPTRLMHSLRAFPIALEPGKARPTLLVAMSSPGNLSAIDEIAFATGLRVKAVATSDDEIERAIAFHVEGRPFPRRAPIEIQVGPADEVTISKLLAGPADEVG